MHRLPCHTYTFMHLFNYERQQTPWYEEQTKGQRQTVQDKRTHVIFKKMIFKKFQFIWEIIQAKSFQFTLGSSEKKAILIN